MKKIQDILREKKDTKQYTCQDPDLVKRKKDVNINSYPMVDGRLSLKFVMFVHFL